VGVFDHDLILEKNEVFIKICVDARNHSQFDCRFCKIIEGDVLVTRNPCMLPSDIRLLKAVSRKELDYFNVIVFNKYAP